MLFVVKGSVNVVYAEIIAVKTVTVSQEIVSVLLILRNVIPPHSVKSTAVNYFRLGWLRYCRLLGPTCDPANDDDDDYHHGVEQTRYYG